MKVIQKAALSIIISLLLFAAFSILAFSSLFDVIETKYYNKKIVGDYENRLQNVMDGVDNYNLLKNEYINEISDNKSLKRVFLTNQSKEDIFQRNNLIRKIKKENIYFKYLRVVDDEGKIHFSTNENDINSQDDFKIIYKTYKKAISESDFDSIDSINSGELLFIENQNIILIKNELDDEFGIKRGFLQISFEDNDLEQYLKKEYLLDKNDNIALIGNSGLVINLFDQSDKVSDLIRENWHKPDYEKIKYIYEDETGKEYALLTFKSSNRFSGFVVLREIFQIDRFYRYILLVVTFFVLNIITFLTFNLRQDRIAVISDRVKRFQINFLIEYLDKKHEIDWKRWKKELRSRKEEVKKEVKKGVKGIKKNQEDDINLLIDKSWEEIIGLLAGRFEGASGHSPANIEISNIDEIVKKILKSELQYSTGTKTVSPVEKSIKGSNKSLKPVEVEEIEELDEVEEVEEELEELDEVEAVEEVEEELDEVEAVEEELEELDEVEAVEEDLEELDEVEAVEEELEELDEVEAVEEELEELDEVEAVEEELEELDEVEAVEEELEELDEVEAVEEELEELDEVEAVEEELEELDEVEAVEEELEELDEVEAVEEELEELDEVEAVEEELEELDEVEAVEEELEELDEVEAVEEELEELDEVEAVEEELEELEELDEVEAVEEELEELDEVEAVEEELEELDEVEAVEEELEELDEVEAVEEELEELDEIGKSSDKLNKYMISVTGKEDLSSNDYDINKNPEIYKNIAEDIISEEAIKMVISAAEKGFQPLSEPETKEEIDKLNLFIRKTVHDGSISELQDFEEDELLETLEEVSDEDLEALKEDGSINILDDVLEEVDDLEEISELEELDEFEEIDGDVNIREHEVIEELESIKEIEPLIIDYEFENVEYLEQFVEKNDIDEYDVDYISNEWIKEYNRHINIMDNVFEEIRKQKMEEQTGFAEMAILEEIKELEYNELENLTFDDKIKLLRKEKKLELYDLDQIADKYKKLITDSAEKNAEIEAKNKTQTVSTEARSDEGLNNEFSNISGFFAKSEIDLPVFDTDNELEEDFEEQIPIDLNKIVSEEFGFDFDMYRGNYSGESAIAYMKALLKISREVKSIYGAILVQDETRYYPEMTVGLNKIDNLLELKKKDSFYIDILKCKKLFYLKTEITGFPEYNDMFSDEDRSFIKSILLIPIKFRNKQGYLFLSPDVNIFTVEDILEKVHNLQK